MPPGFAPSAATPSTAGAVQPQPAPARPASLSTSSGAAGGLPAAAPAARALFLGDVQLGDRRQRSQSQQLGACVCVSVSVYVCVLAASITSACSLIALGCSLDHLCLQAMLPAARWPRRGAKCLLTLALNLTLTLALNLTLTLALNLTLTLTLTLTLILP